MTLVSYGSRLCHTRLSGSPGSVPRTPTIPGPPPVPLSPTHVEEYKWEGVREPRQPKGLSESLRARFRLSPPVPALRTSPIPGECTVPYYFTNATDSLIALRDTRIRESMTVNRVDVPAYESPFIWFDIEGPKTKDLK